MDAYRSGENKVITIYDIAKEAGVSASTVSRVLTNNAHVRNEKKQRVLELIEKYDFKPNAMARGLSDTRSKVIGIITADIRNPFYADVFVACEVAAQKAGYTVMLCNALGEQMQEEKLLEKLQEQRVDVVIQMGGRVDDLVSDASYVEKVNKLMNNIPMVVTGKLDGTQCYQVRIDAMKCVDLLMEHLIELGHREIALIGGRMNVLSTFEKFQRYKQNLSRYKIAFKEELTVEDGGYDYETGYARMNKMLDQGIRPTAVIAINDFAAVGIVRSIQEHGLRIPQDISVVSYDNTYVSELISPKLTTIDYNYESFGEQLIETAVASIEGGKNPKLQLIPPTLIVRGSSGKVPEIIE